MNLTIVIDSLKISLLAFLTLMIVLSYNTCTLSHWGPAEKAMPDNAGSLNAQNELMQKKSQPYIALT